MSDHLQRRITMVDTQVRPSDVTKFPIIDAMLTIPREAFVPRDKRDTAYVGENIDLGAGRVVFEPRTLAKMLDALAPSQADLALVVGAGYGYSAAVLARIAEAVVAVEDDADRLAEAQTQFSENGVDNVILHDGPLTEGAPEHAPYDLILIEGAVGDVPQTLIDQLKDGGRIACLFATGALGEVRIGYKIDGAMSWRLSFNAGAPVIPGFERQVSFAL